MNPNNKVKSHAKYAKINFYLIIVYTLNKYIKKLCEPSASLREAKSLPLRVLCASA